MDIEDRLERIEKKLDQLLAKLGNGASAGGGMRAAPPSSAGDKEVASDADLDSPRGNPEVRFVPKRWSGEDMKGRRYSETEPEFLEMLADTLEWMANKDDESGAVDKNGNPKSKWGRLDASRARGWARRMRAERGESPRGGGASARGGSSMGGSSSRGAPSGGASARRPTRPSDDMMDPMGDDGDAESIPF
ncbi:MAG: hypothetical protein JNK05_00490 [Myxococcales bacterium]|nr:hypothetical protein [Myxococcales bacterium]